MAELWQLAARWLNSVGVLPSNDPSLRPDARVYDLAMALQDGTIICNCVNKITPNAITNINQNPEKQFMKMTNINHFLETMRGVYKIKDADLFAADELYYASKFAKVVHTLSVLSKTSQAQAAGFRPFPEGRAAASNKAEENGQDMYQSLEDLVGQSLSLKEVERALPVYAPDEEYDDADIYGAITQTLQGAEAVDDVYADLVAGNMAFSQGGVEDEEGIYGMGNVGPAEKRSRVLHELHETEKNYVGVLETINNVFKPALSASGKGVSRADSATIFANIHELLDAHNAFLKEMSDIMSKSTGRIISDCFLHHMDNFRCYGEFCCKIPEATDKLKELAAKPASNKMLEAAKSESKQRFPLKDLLNVPMQRILKYPLLLKELIKTTPETHPDQVKLKQALSSVEQLATYINQTKREHDNLKQLISSLNGYRGKPIQEYGTMVKDGDLMFKCTATKEKMKPRYVFLLTRGVLVCKEKGSCFSFKQPIELSDTQELVDVPYWTLPKDEQNGKYTYAWAINEQVGRSEVQYLFAAKTLQAKKKWMSAMQTELDVMKDEKNGPPPVQARTMKGGQPMPPVAPRPQSTMSSRELPLPPTPQSSGSSTRTSPAASGKKKKQSYESWAPMAPGAASAVEEEEPAAKVDKMAADDTWYAGRMPRAKAEKVMEGMPDGAFLVRESDSRQGEYSLSVMYQQVKHIKINRDGNKYDVAPDSKAFPSIQELVEYFQLHSLNRHFPGMETTLRVPFRDAMPGAPSSLPPGATGSSASGLGRARSRFAYKARNPDELSFERGVELLILSTEEVDPDWWRGLLPNGQEGIFPANYVQRL